MKRLRLDFVQTPRPPVAMVVLVCTALLWAMWLVGQWRTVRSEMQRDQARGAELARLVRARRMAVPASAGPAPGEIETEKKMVSMLAYPWNQFFLRLEQSASPDLSIVELKHSQVEDKTEITVEAQDLAAVLQFVASLNDGLQRHPWYVASYQLSPSGGVLVKANIRRR